MEFLRKPIVKIAAVLFILLTIFVLILLFYINQNLSKPLPALYVDGPLIKRSDTQQPVLLKGGTSNLFYSEREKPFSEGIEALEDKLRDWRINLLTVGFDITAIMNPSQYQDLDLLIDYTQQRGIYVIFWPKLADYKDIDFSDEKVSLVMGFLAERYSGKPHIMYLLGRPIGSVQWDQWLPWARKIATSIRDKNPNAILLLSGTEYGRDFRGFKDKIQEFPFQNFALAVYDQWAPNQDIRSWWVDWIGRLPIIIIEFGGGFEGCQSESECEFGYMIKTLKIVNKDENGKKRDTPVVHYTIQGIENFVQDDNTLSDIGEIISSDLKNYLPTDFRKKKFLLF